MSTMSCLSGCEVDRLVMTITLSSDVLHLVEQLPLPPQLSWYLFQTPSQTGGLLINLFEGINISNRNG